MKARVHTCISCNENFKAYSTNPKPLQLKLCKPCYTENLSKRDQFIDDPKRDNSKHANKRWLKKEA